MVLETVAQQHGLPLQLTQRVLTHRLTLFAPRDENESVTNALKRKYDDLEDPSTASPAISRPTVPRTNMCEDCQEIDFDKILSGEEVNVGIRFRTLPRNRCPLCFMLFKSWSSLDRQHSQRNGQRSSSDVLIGHPLLGGGRCISKIGMEMEYWYRVPGSPRVLAVHGRGKDDPEAAHESSSDELGHLIIMDANEPPSPLVPRPIPTRFDPEPVAAWIGYCDTYHSGICGHVGEPLKLLQLVDCQSLLVVEAPRNAKYIALSYVWKASGSTCETTIDTQNYNMKPLPSPLPLVVRDAIHVTNALGYRYLWIDKFCIDQNNAARKHVQIRHMDAVYEMADITIIAAAGNDEDFGLPGASIQPRVSQPVAHCNNISVISSMRDPHKSIRDSRWNSRGWTFQEAVLSRRRLVFTNEQVYFECNAMSHCESFESSDKLHIDTEGTTKGSTRPGIFRTLNPSKLPLKLSFNKYLANIEQYTSRQLSYEEDSLNAFRGIMQRFSETKPPIHQIFGIPIPLTDNPSEMNDSFVYALGWCHKHSCWDAAKSPSRRVMFPSWSWAGWGGEVSFLKRHEIQREGRFIPEVTVLSPPLESVCAELSNALDLFSGSVSTEPEELVLEGFTINPQVFTSCTSLELFLSAGASNEADFKSRLRHDQTIRCLSLGRFQRHQLIIMVLEKAPNRNDEAYSRIGMFQVRTLFFSSSNFGDLGQNLSRPKKGVYKIV
ncbi:heterokaryon incompatibility protein-domain-containing protein [Cercophora newfieldiana]|uniref:Heterokaryon incompatibility protein-domain-containing protein n=1 Tax=Cercophora newfieldiana TaxID=92897 RepID=A0AA39XZD2_9PEZI|nr:heterokaryon incompatibility protein-domain-containing protein [Cercophora newfieldiana]